MSDSIHRVTGTLGFSEPMDVRSQYHANDTARDVLNVVPRGSNDRPDSKRARRRNVIR